jgi:hypothetical protein
VPRPSVVQLRFGRSLGLGGCCPHCDGASAKVGNQVIEPPPKGGNLHVRLVQAMVGMQQHHLTAGYCGGLPAPNMSLTFSTVWWAVLAGITDFSGSAVSPLGGVNSSPWA